MPTLMLQLIFDPSNTSYTPYGRFLPLVLPATTLSSKVWITDTGNVTSDKTNATVLAGNTSPVVSINIIGQLPTGYTWANNNSGWAIRVSAVFGRATHANSRSQDYASPFGVTGTPPAVTAVFDVEYSASQMQTSAGVANLSLGQAQLYDSPQGGFDVYAFNVGVIASITQPGQTNPTQYTFGHDPDMNVGD